MKAVIERELNTYNISICQDWLEKNTKIMPQLNDELDSQQLTDIANTKLKYQVTHNEFMAACVEAGYDPKRVPGSLNLWYLNIELKA